MISYRLTESLKMNKFQIVENLAIFLTEQKGSCLAVWRGKMPAKQQRELFGVFLGKGDIVIDGTNETVKHVKTVGFGQDHEVTFESAWDGINTEVGRLAQWSKGANV